MGWVTIDNVLYTNHMASCSANHSVYVYCDYFFLEQITDVL